MQTAHEKEYARQYRLKHKERRRAYNAEYFRTERYKEWNRVRTRADRLKTNAKAAINIRIKKGTLTRGSCVFCGSPNAQAHHEDYSKPRSIVWACVPHHHAIHCGDLSVLPSAIVEVQKRAAYASSTKAKRRINV